MFVDISLLLEKLEGTSLRSGYIYSRLSEP